MLEIANINDVDSIIFVICQCCPLKTAVSVLNKKNQSKYLPNLDVVTNIFFVHMFS